MMETIRTSSSNSRPRAVFLDRDGVLIEDAFPITTRNDVRIEDGAPEALWVLAEAGYKLIVVTNQTVVARGLLSEVELLALEREIEGQLIRAGAPEIDGFYYCPHHPRADVAQYRRTCECRKPRAGMLYEASRAHTLDLGKSFIVGDRISDIAAGHAAGCMTILVETGQHLAPPIEGAEQIDPNLRPAMVCRGLLEAARWIVEGAL